MNLKMHLIQRAMQISREIAIFKSWKTFFKQIHYKILGKSLAWELAKQEAINALKQQKRDGWSAWEFLKSEKGWGDEFDEKMGRLLQQPH